MADAAAGAAKRRKKKKAAAPSQAPPAHPQRKQAPASAAPRAAPIARAARGAEVEEREATWRDYVFLCVRAVAIVVVFAALDSVWRRYFGRGARPPRSEMEQVMAQLCPNGPLDCPYDLARLRIPQ